MTLVRFYFNGSLHNSVVFCFSDRNVLTSSLALCLAHDHVYIAWHSHKNTIIIYILCITRSELLYFN